MIGDTLHCVVMAMMDTIKVAFARNDRIMGAIAIAPMGDGIVAGCTVSVNAGVGRCLANRVLNGLTQFMKGIAVLLFLRQHRTGKHGWNGQSEDGGGTTQK